MRVSQEVNLELSASVVCNQIQKKKKRQKLYLNEKRKIV